jgi:alpha-N-acetylglucosamine transferase
MNCLELVDYEKIILIDPDTLVLKNCDMLFFQETPSYIMRNSNTINDGFILIKPDNSDYDSIKKEIKKKDYIEYKNPLEKYLSSKKYFMIDPKYFSESLELEPYIYKYSKIKPFILENIISLFWTGFLCFSITDKVFLTISLFCT